MKDSVIKIIDSMVNRARAIAQKLKAQYEADGQLALPQLLASEAWTNSKGEEFGLAIMLELTTSVYGRELGFTSLQFYTFQDEKFMKDHYHVWMYKDFSKSISSEEFREETEKFLEALTADDGRQMKNRIKEYGTYAVNSFVVPQIAQMDIRRLPSNCILSVGNTTFEGAEGIMQYIQTQTDNSQPYIIEYSKRFPCFDAEDYATERRFYRNFLICQSKADADRKAEKINQLKESNRTRLVQKDLPADMRPMVYYEDESASMLLAF